MPTYPRPPIVEAVIDVRFTNELRESQMDKAAKKLKQNYPVAKTIFKDFGIIIEVREDGPRGRDFNQGQKGRRLETKDADWLVLIYPTQLAFFRLAPYPNWEVFIQKFKEVWALLKDVTGPKNISRVAIRYVNRIDIPVTLATDTINIADYLNVGVNSPEGLSIEGYEAVMAIKLDAKTNAVVKTATQQPALPNTAALLLDLDLFIESELPKNDEHLYETLESLRMNKNFLFEKYVTETSRNLFKRELD